MTSFRKGESGRIVRKTLADGSVKEYRYPNRRGPKTEKPFADDSLGALIEAYKRSPEWLGLAHKSRITYDTYLKVLQREPHVRVANIARRDLLDLRDAIAVKRGKGAGTGFVRSCGVLFTWAVDREWIEHSPAARIKTLPGGHLRAWTEQDVATALPALAEPLRRVVVLALHTGQRRGDLVRLTWADYDGQTIRLRQEKTKRQVEQPLMVLPVHPTLKAELDVWKADTSTATILAMENGAPWPAQRVSEVMRRALDKIDGLQSSLNVHGLRKLAATRLADAGCSTHEIAAVTGHRTLGMVALYTATANQERLATAAIHRLRPKG